MRIIGLDPGTSGGYAVLEDGKLVEVDKWSDKTMRETWLCLAGHDGSDTTALVEKVSSTPQMGVKSSFTFGRSFGQLEAYLTAMAIPWDYVTPRKWQTQFGLIQRGRKLGQGDSAKKRLHRDHASRLYPEIRVTHAIADALLIATYGWLIRSK